MIVGREADSHDSERLPTGCPSPLIKRLTSQAARLAQTPPTTCIGQKSAVGAFQRKNLLYDSGKGMRNRSQGRARPENRGHPARIVCEILWPILPDEVWSKIRDFNEDTWTGEVSKSWSENGKSGEAIGAVRIIQVGSARIRQDLRGYSNEERFYTCGYFGSRHFPFMTIKQRYA